MGPAPQMRRELLIRTMFEILRDMGKPMAPDAIEEFPGDDLPLELTRRYRAQHAQKQPSSAAIRIQPGCR